MKNLFLFTKRRFFTILETLIAMFLLSFMLLMIFGFFRELSVINRMTDLKQKEAFRLRYAESRLAYVFERVVNENSTDRLFYFYAQEPDSRHTNLPNIVFTFNNEIRRDPLHSGDVLAGLYVNKSNQLCLLTWPLARRDLWRHMHKEILLNNVKDINFEFYAAPERVKSDQISIEKVDPEAIERNKWHRNVWPNFKEASKREMPSIIKIIVTLDGAKESKDKDKKDIVFEFAFVLPSSKNPVYYPTGGE